MSSKQITNSELSLFCYQLSLVFKAGLPLDEAMEIFTGEMTTDVLKKIAEELKNDIFEGEAFNDAIKKHDEFPKYMLGMIDIAYNTGNLEEELQRLSDYYQEVEEINQKIVSSITYPAILSILMLVVIGFLVIKVIPMFNYIIQSIGITVPKGTQTLLNIAVTLKNYGLIILAVVVALCVGFYYYSKKSANADKLKYEAKFFGPLNKKIFASKFALGMSMLLNGGYSFDDALEVFTETVESKYLASKLSKARENILNGEDVSKEMEDMKLFPALFTRMISIGYKTGQMDNALEKIAKIYKVEVDKSLDRLTSSIEPILVIVLSSVVGIILFTVMTPLVSIISSL